MMIRKTSLVALAAVAAACSFGSLASAQTAAPAAAPASGGAKILVVSMDRVFGESEENKDFQKKLNARVAELQSAREMRAAKLKELQTKAQGLLADTNFNASSFEAANKELEAAQIDAQVADEMAKAEIDRMQKVALRVFTQKLDKEVEGVARDMGATLVISDMRANVSEAMWALGKNDQLRNVVGSRLVLYVSPDANVTDQVVSRLNTAYAKAGALPSN